MKVLQRSFVNSTNAPECICLVFWCLHFISVCVRAELPARALQESKSTVHTAQKVVLLVWEQRKINDPMV